MCHKGSSSPVKKSVKFACDATLKNKSVTVLSTRARILHVDCPPILLPDWRLIVYTRGLKKKNSPSLSECGRWNQRRLRGKLCWKKSMCECGCSMAHIGNSFQNAVLSRLNGQVVLSACQYVQPLSVWYKPLSFSLFCKVMKMVHNFSLFFFFFFDQRRHVVGQLTGTWEALRVVACDK